MRISDFALLAAAAGVVLLLLMRRWAKASSAKASKSDVVPAANGPVPIPPATIDTEGAIEDMRLAKSYLDDWGQAPNNDHVLGLAAKYIDAARRKDPNAKLFYETKQGEQDYRTQDELAGIALFFEANRYTVRFADRQMLEKARDILRKAIAYAPNSILYRSQLADVYLNLHDRPSALGVAEDAMEVNPKDLDARKLMDRIQAAPNTSPPGFFERNPYIIVAVASLLLTGGVVALVASIFGDYGGLAGTLLLSGTVLWFVGRSGERREMFDMAQANEKRLQEDLWQRRKHRE